MGDENQKSGYMQHNQLWLTEDLRVGDIVHCKMLTKYDGAAEAEICPRTVMILGFEMNPDTLEYTSIHVARFSHTSIYCRDDQAILFHAHMGRKGLISGIDVPCVLQIDRTDFLPLTQDHFYGDVVDVTRIGRVDEKLFDEICEGLEMGRHLPTASRSRYPGRNPNRWYLPAMHLAGEAVQNPHPVHGFSDLSEMDIARIHADWATRSDTDRLDGDYVMECIQRLDKVIQKTRSRELSPARKKAKSDANAVHTPVLQSSLNALFARADQLQSMEQADEHASSVRRSLPAHMWQGRYVMMRIANLTDSSDRGQASRPCAIWKTYTDRDSGELVGLELHPVTREQADTFRYKFPVHPTKTTSQLPAFLVADCIVRVPLEACYFDDSSKTPFYELPQDKLTRFTQKREHVLSSGAPVTIYGLQEIPENWVEAEMVQKPSPSQFAKWAKRNEIRFDG